VKKIRWAARVSRAFADDSRGLGPREIHRVTYSARDAATVRGIFEAEADRSGDHDHTKIHPRAPRCVDRNTEETSPLCCPCCARRCRRFVRSRDIIRRQPLIGAVLESHGASLSRAACAVVDVRYEVELGGSGGQACYRLTTA
jgi:hypothetical protein